LELGIDIVSPSSVEEVWVSTRQRMEGVKGSSKKMGIAKVMEEE